MEFDGSLCARNWVTQFQNIGKIYNLDDGCMHMLLIAKLKGNAQRWLHASATRILESTDQLCEQLILTFEVKMSKGELRNAFQKREWHPDEKFARECLKPKREPGSCYACGAFGHFVGQCPERKSANINNYNAS
ncbi:uncharacterized protein LOC117149095 [Drosophila mauritiana]|uniref:Uncharacterized protein LOC117149095 n=1 Tax=Drosophila mauritiana TaxID=7226 RepID=A0A6P8KR27_DROMA|nr:uncharacterized protein LOC117149095 [Drosophila mauritiana]